MTKRLPDFATSKIWKELRNKMGATFSVEMPSLQIDEISFDEIRKLQTSNIDIENIKDHIDPLDQTFNYKGQKVILYIKQQYRKMRELENPRWEYKYHLSFCNHLNKMEAEGRFKSRYVVTQRVDGKFLVDIIAIETKKYLKENFYCKMNVCKICLSQLRRHYPAEQMFLYNAFSLERFLKKYNTKHTKRPLHSPQSMPKNIYSKDWNEISRKIREQHDYICSSCNLSFVHQKENLHVHHIDGVKWNNDPRNLQVLCIGCHSLKPCHQFLLNKNSKNNYDI